MRKRLRKKLHRGEFQEFGFAVAWQFTRALDTQAADLFLDALVDIISARGLTFGGGAGPEEGSGFICKAGRGSASEEDRSQVAEWFLELAPAVSAKVGAFEDAWHSSPPQVTSVVDWIARDAEAIVMPPVRK